MRTLASAEHGRASVHRQAQLAINRYDLPHLGHARTDTQLDFLVRLLRARGLAVTYVQNITDVDDKIIRRARAADLERTTSQTAPAPTGCSSRC